MANSLKSFNLSEALNGAILAFSNDNQTVSQFVFNFVDTKGAVAESRYKANAGNKTYYFNSTGICSDNNPNHRLYIVVGTIVPTKGEDAGAVAGDTIKIVSLNPREQFAASALTGLLHNIPNPLELDAAKILVLSSIAFQIAQGMLNEASINRERNSEGEPSEEIEVKPGNISSTSDKILYNLTEQIKKLNSNIEKIKTENLDKDTKSMETIRDEVKTIDDSLVTVKDEMITMDNSVNNIYETMAANADKVKKVDVAAVSVQSVPASVSGTVYSHVTNMPTVPTEPVDVIVTNASPIEVTGEVTINETA